LLGLNSTGTTSDDSVIWYLNITSPTLVGEVMTSMAHFATTSAATGYHCLLRLLYSRLLDEAIQNGARVAQYPFRLVIASVVGGKLAIDANGSDSLIVHHATRRPLAWAEVCTRLFEPQSHRELHCALSYKDVARYVLFEYLDSRIAGGVALEATVDRKLQSDPSAPAEIAALARMFTTIRGTPAPGPAPSVPTPNYAVPSNVPTVAQMEDQRDLPTSTPQATTMVLAGPDQLLMRVDKPKYVYFGRALFVTFVPDQNARFELNELVMNATQRDLGLRAADFMTTFAMLAFLFDQTIHLKDGSMYCWADGKGRIRQCKTGLIAWLSNGGEYSFYAKYGYTCERDLPDMTTYWERMQKVPPTDFGRELQLAVRLETLPRPQQYWLYEASQFMTQLSEQARAAGLNILQFFMACLKTIGAADMPIDSKPGTLLDALHRVVTSPQPYRLSLEDNEVKLSERWVKKRGRAEADNGTTRDENPVKRAKTE
jgi:hypothetical protein